MAAAEASEVVNGFATGGGAVGAVGAAGCGASFSEDRIFLKIPDFIWVVGIGLFGSCHNSSGLSSMPAWKINRAGGESIQGTEGVAMQLRDTGFARMALDHFTYLPPRMTRASTA
jgi:hypothetical protein